MPALCQVWDYTTTLYHARDVKNDINSNWNALAVRSALKVYIGKRQRQMEKAKNFKEI